MNSGKGSLQCILHGKNEIENEYRTVVRGTSPIHTSYPMIEGRGIPAMNDTSLGTYIPALIDGFFLTVGCPRYTVDGLSAKSHAKHTLRTTYASFELSNKVQRPRRAPRHIPSAVLVGEHKALHDVRRRVRREPAGDVGREEVGGVRGVVWLAKRQEVEEEARYQERCRAVEGARTR